MDRLPLPLDQILDQIEPERIPVAIMRLSARLLTTPVPNGTAMPAPITDDTLDAKAIAKLLRKSPRWVWRNQRKLKFLRRVGRGLVASRSEVERWISTQKIK